MKPFFLLLCSALFLFACSSDTEEPDTDSDLPEEPVVDVTAPALTVSGIPDLIEILTQINIGVTDESNTVTTTVILDDEIIYEGTEKQFEISINPFDYSIGSKTLTVSAIDANGNLTTESIDFELKKLLLTVLEALRGSDTALADVYLAINDLNGELIEVKKIESNDTASFYAEDDFEEQNFTFTSYIIGKEPQSFQFILSSSEIPVGTTIPSVAQSTTCSGYSRFGDSEVELDIVYNHFPKSASYQSLFGTSTGTKPFRLRYNMDEIPYFFVYAFPYELIPIEEYEYFVMTDFDQTTFGLSDFQKPVMTTQINIPEAEWFSLLLRAYLQDEDYTCDKFHEILDLRVIEDLPNNTLEVPTFDFFESYLKMLTLNYPGGKQLQLWQKGIERDFIMPGVDMTLVSEGVSFIGNSNEIEFQIANAEFLPSGTVNSFNWTFNCPPKEMHVIPFYSFELPEAIINELQSKSLQYDPRVHTVNRFQAIMKGYESDPSYLQVITNPIYTSNERGDTFTMYFDLNQ